MSDIYQREMDEAAKKFTAASKKIERAIAKYRAADFEGRPSEAKAEIGKALNRLYDQSNKVLIHGNEAFRGTAREMIDRLYEAMNAAESHANDAWQSKVASVATNFRMQQQRDWNDLPEHIREQRMNAAGIPYKPR